MPRCRPDKPPITTQTVLRLLSLVRATRCRHHRLWSRAPGRLAKKLRESLAAAPLSPIAAPSEHSPMRHALAIVPLSLLFAACSGNEIVGIHIALQKDGPALVTTRALVD